MEDKLLELNKCEICGKVSEDVEYTINPYIQEIGHEEIWEYLCDDCYNEYLMDI